VGVRHIHALAHPGLQFLILTDGSLQAEAALALGAQLARLAHARAVILGYGLEGEAMQRLLQQAKETLGSGLAALEVRGTPDPLAAAVGREVERRPCDLVIMGYAATGGLDLAEAVLQAGEHNLLLVPGPQGVPERALICVTTGEPGKDDVLFAGRLMRHVGAQAALMSILEVGENGPVRQERTERFLAGGVRSLDVLGVPAEAIIRAGPVSKTVAQELATGGYDLLVLGTPLADLSGQISLRRGAVGQVMSEAPGCATLLVRSSQATVPEPATAGTVRI
jgi:sulfate transport system ATP-binding protein